ncbi:MAG: YegP family protein, partial [Litorimonas sp.]
MARNLDEYRPLAFYGEHSQPRRSGFAKFEVDGDHYFCRYVDGNIALISQSYQAAKGRDNGIDSVRKNEKTKARYRFEERENGKHGFSLRAGNNQEIAVSPDFDTLAEAERISGRIRGTVKATKAAPAGATAVAKPRSKPKTKTDGRRGNDKPLAFYAEHDAATADGFGSFTHEGAHYFTYRKGGEIRLISEAYTSARARDNGIASVKANMAEAARYTHRTHANGKYYFDLMAGNRQEIATSPWYEGEDAALAAAADLRGERTAGGSDHDNYQPLAFYQDQTASTEDGMETFTGTDGLHYFVYRQDGDIALVSEGYATTGARDRGMASVQRNMGNQLRYDDKQGGLGGATGYRLKAANNREIARSVPHAS